MASESIPVEPGWHLVRVDDVGEAVEWGPRLAGVHSQQVVMMALAGAARLHHDDELAIADLARTGPTTCSSGAVGAWSARLARCEGLVELERAGRGLTITAKITDLGRLVLSVAGALRRAGARS
jgi:hypothetical protein